jgi:hypothetical protein
MFEEVMIAGMYLTLVDIPKTSYEFLKNKLLSDEKTTCQF